ncbi:ABC transporter permease [Baekduia soli]|uniref:ABC transporter permease n=1 Tax=Baekduia soli TaxID=496014 RepID=A0A5B8UB54_9ACTN|nr:ABC transporter permease [Baekduia soli]QEC50386.1 ABC transporter permease [Baekduia soli]
MVALRTVYAWELRKLVAQRRTYLGLGAAVLVPLIFVAALALQTGQPEDVPFGRYVRQSGLAIPPVILIFGSYWLFPLITALVSGDIVAAEDHNGTLKTILTRSVGRGRIFTAKVLAAFTYALVALVAMGATAIIGGVVKSGFNPLVTLSGTTVGAGRALVLVGASLLVYALPLIAVASIAVLLSTVTRNSAAAVVGALMISLLLQLVTIIPGLGALHPYLLPTQFNAWQGFLRTPADYAPIVRAAWVCALYAVPCLGASYLVFLRRDVTGG